LGDCYQVVGFDLFIDQNLKVWVLEVNDHPSMNLSFQYETDEGSKASIVSAVDKFVKLKMIGDAVKLMKKKSVKCKRHELVNYKNWTRISPAINSIETEDFFVFLNAKRIFDEMNGKQGLLMSCNTFAKLSKAKRFQGSVQRVSLEIMCKRVLQQAKTGFLDQTLFFDLLEDVAHQLYPNDRSRLTELVTLLL